jgi:predicted DNA binding CopG/RHH family protein
MTKREQKSYFQRDMSVPKEQITIPKFKTEAEEAAWWDSHPETAAEIMEQALKSGSARRKVALKTVTMRLPMADLEAAQDLANRKGLPYQTYIKMVLHGALQKERRSA